MENKLKDGCLQLVLIEFDFFTLDSATNASVHVSSGMCFNAYSRLISGICVIDIMSLTFTIMPI